MTWTLLTLLTLAPIEDLYSRHNEINPTASHFEHSTLASIEVWYVHRAVDTRGIARVPRQTTRANICQESNEFNMKLTN